MKKIGESLIGIEKRADLWYNNYVIRQYNYAIMAGRIK